jgi:type II secretory pathway pseudopilin PulG
MRDWDVRLLRRIAGGESGFTLIETVAVTGLLAVVMAAVLTLAETSQRIAPRDRERAHVIRESQLGLHRMTRELRQSYALLSWSETSIEARVLVNGTATRVVYDCNQQHPTDTSLKRCARWVVQSNGATTPKIPVVDRILSGSFAYEGGPPPEYAQVTVTVPAKGELKEGYAHKVVLDDGFYMRNLGG